MTVAVTNVRDCPANRRYLRILKTNYVLVQRVLNSNCESGKISRFLSSILKILQPCLNKQQLEENYLKLRNQIIQELFNVQMTVHTIYKYDDDVQDVDVDEEEEAEQEHQRNLHFIMKKDEEVQCLDNDHYLSLLVSSM